MRRAPANSFAELRWRSGLLPERTIVINDAFERDAFKDGTLITRLNRNDPRGRHPRPGIQSFCFVATDLFQTFKLVPAQFLARFAVRDDVIPADRLDRFGPAIGDLD